MAKDKRSNKWAFIMYEESCPDNYLEVLENLHVPFVLSPWHNADVNKQTGDLKKSHKHGALYFDSLKSYTQASELLSTALNCPEHVEIVMSPKALYDYFTHAENPDKTPYDIKDIESGSGFDLESFLMDHNSNEFVNEVIDIIETHDIKEFGDLVQYVRTNDTKLLGVIVRSTYFFAKYLDSRRHSLKKKPNVNKENDIENN